MAIGTIVKVRIGRLTDAVGVVVDTDGTRLWVYFPSSLNNKWYRNYQEPAYHAASFVDSELEVVS